MEDFQLIARTRTDKRILTSRPLVGRFFLRKASLWEGDAFSERNAVVCVRRERVRCEFPQLRCKGRVSTLSRTYLAGFLGVAAGLTNRRFFSLACNVAIPSPVTLVPCNLNERRSLRSERCFRLSSSIGLFVIIKVSSLVSVPSDFIALPVMPVL